MLAGLPQDDRLLDVAVGDSPDVANGRADPGLVDHVAEPGDRLRQLVRARNPLEELLELTPNDD
jgi:hypothetical protein